MGRLWDRFDEESDPKKSDVPAVQWGLVNGAYVPAGATLHQLPAGAYQAFQTPLGGFRLEPRQLFTDGLFDLQESISHPVLRRIQTFWASKEKFRFLRQLHKRGILFLGAPGTGKSSIVMLLGLNLMESDGIILLADRPALFAAALRTIRNIEPYRPIICIMEDIDRWTQDEDDTLTLLSLLDGENQVDNVVHLATTNFPEQLDDRILGRPSRFDEIVRLELPHPELRRAYLQSCAPGLAEGTITKWVADTEGMNFGHLRELVVATQALACDYDETLARLRSLKAVRPTKRKQSPIRGFGRDDIGTDER